MKPTNVRKGSSVPKGRNYQGNRFAALVAGRKKKQKAKPATAKVPPGTRPNPFQKGKAPAFGKGKKPKVPAQALPLALAMRSARGAPFGGKA